MTSFEVFTYSTLGEYLYGCLQFVLPLLVTVVVVRLSRSIALATCFAVATAILVTALSGSFNRMIFVTVNGLPRMNAADWAAAIGMATATFAVLGVTTARRWLPRRPGEPLIHRRFRQFSLATLFAVVTIAACGLGIARYFLADLLQWLPTLAVVTVMVNPFRVVGDWARNRARLQAVRARLRRAAQPAASTRKSLRRNQTQESQP